MRSTVFIIVALLCAGLLGPARAAGPAAAPSVPVFDLREADFPADVIVADTEAPAALREPSFLAIDAAVRAGDTAALTVRVAPVPEPVSVLMLMCGLLLIVPGGWLTRWSMLGDRESLLRRSKS